MQIDESTHFSAIDFLSMAGFAYAALLGIRSVRRTSVRGFGISLVVLALAGGLAWSGVELDLPITVASAADGTRETVDIPLLRTLAELAAGSAIGGLLLGAFDAWRRGRGKEPLLRVQRTALWIGVVLVATIIVYQVHFSHALPIRTAVLSIGGATVFVVGLGMQATLGNVFAGYTLQAANVFRKGDTVQFGQGGIIGTILDSTLSTTRVLTREGETLVIPNSAVLAKDFLNLDHPVPRLWQSVKIGASYETPPAIVKDAAMNILRTEEHVLRDPPPRVWVSDYADSAVIYDLRFWITSFRERDDTLDSVRTRLWYAFRDAGINIPFPIRTVRMADMAEERSRHDAAEARTERLATSLRACPLLAHRDVTDANRRDLARDGADLSFEGGSVIVRRGEESDSMFVVTAGACEVHLPSGDRVRMDPGSHFGEIALLTGEPRTADVVAAAEGTSVIRLPKHAVVPVLARHPEFRARFSAIAQERRDAADGASRRAAQARSPSFVRRMVGMLRPF